MTEPEAPADKVGLRRHFRQRRKAIPDRQRIEFDLRIHDHLAQGLAQRPLRGLAAYLAFDGEPELEPLLRRWHGQGVQLALPVVPPGIEDDMSMRRWEPDGEMGRNVLGIREPVVGVALSLRELDVVLMPLVAFDAHGNRLGMGAGYYDRFLAQGPLAGPPLRVGVAYACQQASSLPSDPWDVPLHAVVTEQGWLSCPP